jgi:hypothetical protein
MAAIILMTHKAEAGDQRSEVTSNRTNLRSDF